MNGYLNTSAYASILPDTYALWMQCLNKSGKAIEVLAMNNGGKSKLPGFSQNFKLSMNDWAWAFGIEK